MKTREEKVITRFDFIFVMCLMGAMVIALGVRGDFIETELEELEIRYEELQSRYDCALVEGCIEEDLNVYSSDDPARRLGPDHTALRSGASLARGAGRRCPERGRL